MQQRDFSFRTIGLKPKPVFKLMIKYYTRACNFKYGSIAKKLIKNKLALPLCGNKNISFDEIEIIITRNKKSSL